MSDRRLARFSGLLPHQGWRHTAIAVLLWSGVTLFIFAIILDKVR
jgi:hypothetical protein